MRRADENVLLIEPDVSEVQARFLASGAEHVLFCGGVGSGKTRAGSVWALRECMMEPAIGFIGANTYQQLVRVTLRAFCDRLHDWKIPYVYNKTPPAAWGRSAFEEHEKILSLYCAGRMTQVITAQLATYDYLRGIEIGWAWIDETRDTKREAFDVLLARKRQQRSRRPIAITTTPDGFDWLYDAFAGNGEHALPNREVVYATSFDNPWLPKGYVHGLLAKYTKRLADQEVLGKFVSLATGQAYAEFNRADHVVDGVQYDPAADLVHSWDFNVNPLCSVVLQKDRNGHPVVIDEIHIEGSARTRDATDAFLDRYRGHKGKVLVYGDRSGGNASTSSDFTDFDTIKSHYAPVFGQRLEMRVNYSNPPVADSVQDVNCLLRSARGDIRLRIAKKCEYTIRDLEQVSFRPGTRELDKGDPELTHHSDALRYYVSNEFPAKRTAGSATPKGW